MSFAQACDRTCLEGFVDKYMDALVAHDPKLSPLAKTLKNTENGQRLEPGDGFWRTATAKGAYRLFVDDPQAGEVAFLGHHEGSQYSGVGGDSSQNRKPANCGD